MSIPTTRKNPGRDRVPNAYLPRTTPTLLPNHSSAEATPTYSVEKLEGNTANSLPGHTLASVIVTLGSTLNIGIRSHFKGEVTHLVPDIRHVHCPVGFSCRKAHIIPLFQLYFNIHFCSNFPIRLLNNSHSTGFPFPRSCMFHCSLRFCKSTTTPELAGRHILGSDAHTVKFSTSVISKSCVSGAGGRHRLACPGLLLIKQFMPASLPPKLYTRRRCHKAMDTYCCHITVSGEKFPLGESFPPPDTPARLTCSSLYLLPSHFTGCLLPSPTGMLRPEFTRRVWTDLLCVSIYTMPFLYCSGFVPGTVFSLTSLTGLLPLPYTYGSHHTPLLIRHQINFYVSLDLFLAVV